VQVTAAGERAGISMVVTMRDGTVAPVRMVVPHRCGSSGSFSDGPLAPRTGRLPPTANGRGHYLVPVNTVPDWITAVATAIAAVATGLAAIFAAHAARAAGHQLEILRQEADSRAREARMAQARLIYWDEALGTGGGGPYGFRLVNASNEPIPSIQVRIARVAPGKVTDLDLTLGHMTCP